MAEPVCKSSLKAMLNLQKSCCQVVRDIVDVKEVVFAIAFSYL